MATKLETRTTTIALAILLSGLLACKMFKKQEDESPAASASAEPASSKASAKPELKQPEPKKDEPKLGDVKRFKDKEKEVEGVVKVLERNVKVFNEPDIKTPHVAELNKDIFVNRLVTLDDFTLVEFPSGVGELSPGWVESKFLSDPDSKVSQEKVKAQDSAAKVVANKDPEPTPSETSKETEKTKTEETEKAAETKQETTEKTATETKEAEKTETEKTAETTKEEPTKEGAKTVVEKVSRKKR